MLTPQAIQGIQFVFNVSFFFFRIELGTKTHGFRYFWVFLGNAVKAYCDWVVNFRTSLVQTGQILARINDDLLLGAVNQAKAEKTAQRSVGLFHSPRARKNWVTQSHVK